VCNAILLKQVIEKVVKNSSLSEMRQTASIGMNHLRRGGYGNWRSMFTVAQSEFFDDVRIPNSSLADSHADVLVGVSLQDGRIVSDFQLRS
jgi:hypothetical protein